MNKNQKGFTIIELIVVIAIIAVLAAIVMVNVTSYINKGKDAAIKGNLTSLMTNSAVWYDDTTHTGYLNFSANTATGCGAGGTVATAVSDAGGTLTCAETAVTGAAWCACSPLKTDPAVYFCVDSTGAKVENATACGTSCTAASPACL